MREGTLTSTSASELTGESTGTCSFHLRQLARYGFIEEAPGGKGRERPWRAAEISLGWASVQEDPSTAAAADALSELMLERRLRDLLTYLRNRVNEPDEWRQAAISMGNLLYLRPDELEQLGEAIVDLMRPYAERTRDPARRPQDARAVQLFAYGFPLTPTPTGH